MEKEDIRWIQRLLNYEKALAQLNKAVALSEMRPLSELEGQGMIQAFEFTHELSWNVMKDYFAHQGNTNINGSRDATREAFAMNLIEDGENWMEMIKSRNETLDSYKEEIALEIIEKIIHVYTFLFIDFYEKMKKRRT